MVTRTQLIGSTVLAIAAFVAGLSSRTPPTVATAQRADVGQPQSTPVPIAPAPAVARSLVPPPLPDEPGLRAWVDGDELISEASRRGQTVNTNRRIDESLGKDFPQAKRDAVLASLHAADEIQLTAVRAYYRGEIGKPELTTAVHRALLVAVRMQDQILTRDEFWRWNTLEPGDDPMLAFGSIGLHAGDSMADDPSGV